MTSAPPPSKNPLSAWSSLVRSCARPLAKALPLPKSVRDLPPEERFDARMALAIRDNDAAGLDSLLRKDHEAQRDYRGRLLAPKALSEAIEQNNPSHLARLLEARANPDALFAPLHSPSSPDKLNGDRLLHAVVKRGLTEPLRMLIDAHARIDLQNDTGQTALAIAARFGLVDMAQTLLQKGARPDKADYFGRLPLDYALRYHPDFDSLLPYGGMNLRASAEEMARLDRGALIAKALLAADSPVINLPPEHNPEGYINPTTLPILAGAIRVKDHELIQTLIERGADTAWLHAPADTRFLSKSQHIQLGWLMTLAKTTGLDQSIDFARRIAALQNPAPDALNPAAAAPVSPESPSPAPLAKARSILASRRAAQELRASLSSETPASKAP